jgi:hypothetical protein
MASVGKAVLLRDGQTAVLVTDFDPATMDVVIVAKDARRVWIEQECEMDGRQVLHTKQPQWDDDLQGWHSQSQQFTVLDNDATMQGAADGDRIEFVAVETRRPVKTPDSLFWDPRDDNQLPHGCTLEVVAAPVPGLAVSHA